jgi:hypothetical protein
MKKSELLHALQSEIRDHLADDVLPSLIEKLSSQYPYRPQGP